MVTGARADFPVNLLYELKERPTEAEGDLVSLELRGLQCSTSGTAPAAEALSWSVRLA